MQRHKRNWYPFVIIATAVIFMAVACFVLWMNYEWLVATIVAVLQKPAIEKLVRTTTLPPHKFRVIKICCAALLLLIPAGAVSMLRRRQEVSNLCHTCIGSIRWGWREVVQVFRRNSRLQNASLVVVLALVTIKCLYYIVARELQYDEMWCYNYLTARPVYVTLFAYNNYPLFELSTQLFKWLPLPVKVSLRLPVLCAGLLSCALLYACLKKWSRSHRAALGGLLVYGFMPVTTIYMLYARGVIFESFFAIAVLFSLLYSMNNSDRRSLVLYGLANAAGLYSMPTHIYLWGLLFLYGAWFFTFRNRRLLKPFLLVNVCGLLLASLLYVPVLAGTGFSFVQEAASHRDLYRKILPNIPAFIASYSDFYTGFETGIIVLAIVAIICMAMEKDAMRRMLLRLILFLCFMPLTVYVLQRLVLPFRSEGFVGLACPLLFALTLGYLERRAARFFQYALGAAAAVLMMVASHYHTEMNWTRQRDRDAVRLTNLLMDRHVRTLYDSSAGSGFPYFYPALEFYYARRRQPLDYSVALPSSIRYKPFAAAAGYDCIVYRIVPGTSALHERYHVLYADTLLNYQVMIRD